jgi:hypothetical protein
MKPPRESHESGTAFSAAFATWWQRWRHPLARVGELCHRIFLIVGYAWVGVEIDLPVVGDYLPLKNVIVCLAAVLFIGKTVLDTLFYDHYQP